MKTRVVEVNAEHPQEGVIEEAAAVIRRGGLVAFPTETVYGLGADATNEAAVRGIFAAKGRPADNPLIVHVSSRAMLGRITCSLPAPAEALMERFWPGPLTLVLRRNDRPAPTVSAGLATVAVRMPQNQIALALIDRADTPIAAPSANRSGRPSPSAAAHVFADLNGRIDMILDGGPTVIGIESTVLDITTDRPLILRPGWITREAIEEVLGETYEATAEDELKRSPGTRYRHYTPRARVILLESATPDSLRQLCEEYLLRGRVGLLSHTLVGIKNENLSAIAIADNAGEYARHLYAALRQLDESRPDVIIVEGIRPQGGGAAVMDRLRRASSEIKLLSDASRSDGCL